MPPPSQRAAALIDTLFADAAASDVEGGFPLCSIDALRHGGLLAAPLPPELGGEGIGGAAQAGELLATLAALGRGSLVVGRLYEGHVNALQLIQRYGSAAQQRRAADDACGGHLFGVWNTEAANGVKLQADAAGGFTLGGSKTFASGLGQVSRALLTGARDDDAGHGWQLLLLATDDKPPREERAFWRPLGMRASASFAAGLDGIHVGLGDLIGAPGDYYREPAFSAGAIRFAAVQQGGVEALFDETRRFLRALGRTDDPHQRTRLGEMAWRVESGRLWLDGAARHACAAMSADADAADTDTDRTVAYARLMRSAIDDNATRVLALCDRAVGARGLLQPEPFERLHRDLTHYLRQPAPDAALAEAGRHVLGDERHAAALWG